MPAKKVWKKVLSDSAKLKDERVMTVTAGHRSFCLTHHEGKFGCLDNKCPPSGRSTRRRLYRKAAFEKLMAHDGPGTIEIMTDALLI